MCSAQDVMFLWFKIIHCGKTKFIIYLSFVQISYAPKQVARCGEVHPIYIKNIRIKFSWHATENNLSYWTNIEECVWQSSCHGNRVSYMLNWNYAMNFSSFLSLNQLWLYHLPFIIFFFILSLIIAGFFRENLNSKLVLIYHHYHHHYHCIITIIIIISSSSSRIIVIFHSAVFCLFQYCAITLKYEEQYIYKTVIFNSYKVTFLRRYFNINFMKLQ